MSLRTKRVLVWATVTVLALAGACGTGAAIVFQRSATDATGTDRTFDRALRIPPLAEAVVDPDGRLVFDLTVQAGTSELLPGRSTQTWGVDGPHLGPTVRANRGDEVLMLVTNELGEPTTLHWHGMHLPASADGGPHQVIAPGDTWAPSWRIDQPAATLWYHPHLHGSTAAHVYRGVAGLFLVDDEDDAPLGLPSDYGTDDVPVILQDVALESAGQLHQGHPFGSTVGFLGDTVLVNGTAHPYLDVTTERVRLRVLNASLARVYDVGLDDGRMLWLVGTDGGLLPEPMPLRSVPLSPGERAEIVVELEPGERVRLRSNAPDLGADMWTERFSGGDDRFDLLELRAAHPLEPAPPLPTTLADDELPQASEATGTRRFELNGMDRINGRTMDMARIDEVVAVDTTEIWELVNRSGHPHNVHIHDVQFRVLTLDGDDPPAHLGGPKDTVYLPPGSSARLVVRFSDYTDPDVPYMVHCHFLWHEDQGMMAQFTVVDPHQVTTEPTHLDHIRH